MDQFHRVYVQFDETLWVGAAWLAQRQELTRDLHYATLSVGSQRELCLTLPDGRILCDFGPKHVHTEASNG